jgi:hypothetical protein
MKVTIIIPKYRCRLGHDHVKGDTCDLPEHVAVKIIGLGYAEAYRARKVETAEKPKPPQNAAKRTGRTITKADFGEEA